MASTKQSSTKGSKLGSISVPERSTLPSNAAAGTTLTNLKRGTKMSTPGIVSLLKSTSNSMMDAPPAAAGSSFKSTSDSMTNGNAADIDAPPATTITTAAAAASFKSTSDSMANGNAADIDAPPVTKAAAAAAASFKSNSDSMAYVIEAVSFNLEGSTHKTMNTDHYYYNISIGKMNDESERDGDKSTRKPTSQKQIEANRKNVKKSKPQIQQALNKEHGLQFAQLLGALVDNPDFQAAQWTTAIAFNGEKKDVVFLTMADYILRSIEKSQQKESLEFSDLTRESQLVRNLLRTGFHIVKEVSRTDYEGTLPPSGSKWMALMWHPLFQRLPNGMVNKVKLAAVVETKTPKSANPFVDSTIGVKKVAQLGFKKIYFYLGRFPENQVKERVQLAKEALQKHARDHPNATKDEFDQMLKGAGLMTKGKSSKERGETMRAAGVQTKEKQHLTKKKSSSSSKNSKKKKSSSSSKNISKKKKSSL